MKTICAAVLAACALVSAQDLTPPKNWSVEKGNKLLIFRPDNLPANQQVQVDIYDSEPADGDLSPWLANQMKAHDASEADLNTCRPKSRPNKEASCVTKTGGADQYWYAFRTPDGQYRFSHIVMGPSTLATVRFFMSINQLMKKAEANAGRAGAEAEVATTNDAAQKAPGDFFPDAPKPAATPTPAAPSTETPALVTTSNSSYRVPIEGLYLHLEYQVGVGGAVYPTYEPYILLPDGTITDDLSYYPSSEADINTWRQKKPREWGRWTKNGNTIAIQWNNPKRKPETWDKWFVAKAGDPGMSISGQYRSIGGGGNTALGGSTMVAAWSNFQFSPDGTVTSSSGAGGGNPNVTVLSQRAAKQARYHIDNYTIDLQYADGRRERAWFFRFPDSDNAIGVGSNVLSKR